MRCRNHYFKNRHPLNICQPSVEWNDGTTGLDKTVTQAGLYWVEVTGSCFNFRDSIQIDALICPGCQASNQFSTTICEGETYEGNSITGIYLDTFLTILGCDSVRTLDLSVIPFDIVVLEKAICIGDSFLGYSQTGFYMDTFPLATGCDSIRLLDLSVVSEIFTYDTVQICLGESYQGNEVSGIFIDTLKSIFGCDSITITQLDVIPLEKELTVTLCSGEQFENYTISGSYIDTIKGVTGSCDTIRNISLSIREPLNSSIIKVICEGDSYEGYNISGIYIDTFSSTIGCDSTRSLTLATIEAVTSHVETSLCDPSLTEYTTAGIFTDTLESHLGCDSIRTLILTGGSKFIPNAFSPNSDGINDLFEVFHFPDNVLRLQYFGIFDRYGNMTYQTEIWPILWDGKRKDGTTYNPGVVSYVMIYYCGDKKIVETGNITLVK